MSTSLKIKSHMLLEIEVVQFDECKLAENYNKIVTERMTKLPRWCLVC